MSTRAIAMLLSDSEDPESLLVNRLMIHFLVFLFFSFSFSLSSSFFFSDFLSTQLSPFFSFNSLINFL